MYKSDEDKMMSDPNIKWFQSSVIKKEKNPAHDWPTYIKEAIKTGLESPIPYKVIPYKNGIGIKKIEFFKPIKNGSL